MMMTRCVDRSHAIVWTVRHLGIPEGFESFSEYFAYVNSLMDYAEYNETYLMDSKGEPVAYFAWCLSEDIHHKGTIFDVTNVVIKPGSKCAPTLWREVHLLALMEGCDWVSRCSHESDGSVKNHFRRVNHG